ncbi:MAG: di-heme oxidoredictase family protein [Dongiaceae bacterium]
MIETGDRPAFFRRRRHAIVATVFLAAAAVAIAGSGSAPHADDTPRSLEDAERVAAVTQPTTDFSKAEPFETNSGGGATTNKPLNASVFSHPSGNMDFERQLDFRVGDGIFRKLWISAPSSTTSSDGLGPLFNARSCQTCHLKDGRGSPPAMPDEAAVALFLRLSIPPQSEADEAVLADFTQPSIPEPNYGGQLQPFSVAGIEAEGRMNVTYTELPVELADGTIVTLRAPHYEAIDLNYGPMHQDVMISPRLAPPMIGMGLLETIPDYDILAHADPDDSDGDGISGAANWLRNPEADLLMLGRFGWKAGMPSVALQTAHAFAGDIGIASTLAPVWAGDCTGTQSACREAPDGRDPDESTEVTNAMFDLVVFYARNLGVPARRDVDDPQVLAGKQLFYDSGCIGCHVPKFVTARAVELGGEPEQSFQLIFPYTDLLLHDMGEGLADHRPESAASGREWRTAPLWGIGLAETVGGGRAHYLHDGRAETMLEAILWHGGEADAAKQKVIAMTSTEREALIAFLRSL